MTPENPDHPFHRLPPAHAKILLECMPAHFRPARKFCRQRSCRRIGACRGAGNCAAIPPCLVGLDFEAADERDQLLEVLSEVYWSHLRSRPDTDDRTRRREDTAIAIMRAALPRMPGRAAAFHRWHDIFIAPPVDAGTLLAEVNAEIARAKQSLALENVIARARR